jgi:hypothetical protein
MYDFLNQDKVYYYNGDLKECWIEDINNLIKVEQFYEYVREQPKQLETKPKKRNKK